MCRRSERTRRAVERAGCEREPQSGRELDERLHGWPFCGDGEDESERGKPKAGTSAASASRRREATAETRAKRGAKTENLRRETSEQARRLTRRRLKQSAHKAKEMDKTLQL